MHNAKISIEKITGGSSRITDVRANELGLFYLETRPKESGRSVLIHAYKPFRTKIYRKIDLTDRQISVRSGVHEYGGGAYFVSVDSVYFINSKDQQIYKVPINQNNKIRSAPVKITDNPRSRFADIDINSETNLVAAIMETHGKSGVQNKVVAADLTTGRKYLRWNEIETSHDFCSTPRISPDGKHISYLVWDHPNMPWDKTNWKVAEISTASGAVEIKRKFQIRSDSPQSSYSLINTQFLNDDTLYGISDSFNGYLNPVTASLSLKRFKNLVEKEAEFGWPHWIFGRNMIVNIGNERFIGAYFNGEKWTLCLMENGSITDIKSDLVNISTITSSKYGDPETKYKHTVYVLGTTKTKQSEIYKITVQDSGSPKITSLNLKPRSDLPRNFFDDPTSITIKDQEGDNLNFIFHRPKHAFIKSLSGQYIKPVIIQMHGGPTSMAEPGSNLITAFFNNLSIGVAEVNYRGSSGFGRKYLQSLYGNWGLYDPIDANRVAQFLIDNNMATSGHLAIRGSSAGGYSVLMSIAKYDIFSGAVSYYGIADLNMLAKDTHKFEARYLDKLIGAQKSESKKYLERSPINLISSIKTPLLIFQGDLDPVVPKNQAQLIYEALKANGVKTKLMVFEGESHGFRMSKTTKRCLVAEVKFYSEIFDYDFNKYIR